MANRSSVALHDGQSRLGSKPSPSASADRAAADSISLSTALTELALAPVRLATSPRALRAYASTGLVVIASLLLYVVAVTAYVLFYSAYVPDTSFTIPIHLQFDHLGHGVALDPTVYHPYAQAKFSEALRGVDIDRHGGLVSWLLGGRGVLGGDRKQRVTGRMLNHLEYDVDVVMTLPRTPSNVAAGNFMLSISLLDLPSSTSTQTSTGSGSETAFTRPGLDPAAPVLAHSSRPTTLTYASPFLSYASQLLVLPLYMLNLRSESEVLRKPMLERVAFPASSSSSSSSSSTSSRSQGSTGVPQQLHLEVRSRERLQIYSVSVEVRARFTGIRWLMSRHRIFSFVFFTSTFWGLEMFIAALVWAGSVFAFSTSGSESDGSRIRSRRRNEMAVETESSEEGQKQAVTKKVEDEDEPDLSDTSRSFPTYAGQPPLRYSSPRVKQEEEEEQQGIGRVGASHDVEADDEDDGQEDEDADFVLEAPGGASVSGYGRKDFDSGIGSSLESSNAADKSASGSIRRRKSDK